MDNELELEIEKEPAQIQHQFRKHLVALLVLVCPLVVVAFSLIGHYVWYGDWWRSILFAIFSVSFCVVFVLAILFVVFILAPLAREVFGAAKPDPDLKLKFLQATASQATAIGLLLTAFGLLLSHSNAILNRFDAVKPLFSVENVLKPGSVGSVGVVSFDEKNDGGWVMFLGEVTSDYLQKRKAAAPTTGALKEDGTPPCEFDLTPRQYQVVHKEQQERGTFKLKAQHCRALLAWVDADGNFYEQKIELSDKNDPKVDAPRVRASSRTWISRLFRPFQLGEHDAPWLPDRDGDKSDGTYFTVHLLP